MICAMDTPADTTGNLPAKKRIDALKARAWDGWIWISSDFRRVCFVPPAPKDAEIASDLGLTLASSTSGLCLVHRGHQIEET